jgi:hypothetical protein
MSGFIKPSDVDLLVSLAAASPQEIEYKGDGQRQQRGSEYGLLKDVLDSFAVLCMRHPGNEANAVGLQLATSKVTLTIACEDVDSQSAANHIAKMWMILVRIAVNHREKLIEGCSSHVSMSSRANVDVSLEPFRSLFGELGVMAYSFSYLNFVSRVKSSYDLFRGLLLYLKIYVFPREDPDDETVALVQRVGAWHERLGVHLRIVDELGQSNKPFFDFGGLIEIMHCGYEDVVTLVNYNDKWRFWTQTASKFLGAYLARKS